MLVRMMMAMLIASFALGTASAGNAEWAPDKSLFELKEILDQQAAELEDLRARVVRLEDAGLHVDAWPRIAYNSGWKPIGLNEAMTLEHNVGGNLDRYIVLLDQEGENLGRTCSGYGHYWDFTAYAWAGISYRHLTESEITVFRSDHDPSSERFRIRIITY